MGGGREREGKREEGLLEAEGVGVKRCWRRRSVSLVDIVGGLYQFLLLYCPLSEFNSDNLLSQTSR